MSTGTPQDDGMKIDDWRLISCLAAGNHTQVWEVVDSGGSRRVAMKLLLPEAFKLPDYKNALKQEIKIAKQFEHPNLLRYFDIVVNKTHGYFTMELFRAPNMKVQIFTELPSIQSRVKRVIEQVASALDHIHSKGWLHKDIKPENILVNKAAEVRLVDFSLTAKVAGMIGQMFSGRKAPAGTLTYIAPEQILNKPLTPATDIYSFGITIYEVLAGRSPFKGSTPNDLLVRHIQDIPAPPSAFNSNVTPEMDRVILKMLAKKPAERYKDCKQLLIELKKVEPFKDDPFKVAEALKAADVGALAEVMEDKLNSRRDHARTSAKKDSGEKTGASAAATSAAAASPVAKPEPAKPATAKPEAVKPTTAAAQKPAANAPARGPVPGSPPGMPMPGQVPPGQIHPGQMPYGYPLGSGYPAGMPMQPGAPMRPGAPGMPYPANPAAGGYYPPGYAPAGYGQPGVPQPGGPAAMQQPWGGAPGQYPPGQYPPGQYPAGQYPPGQMPQQYPAGQVAPGRPGQVPGQAPRQPMPGQMQPGQMPPGQVQPGQVQPGQMPVGQVPPGQWIPGQVAPGGAPQRANLPRQLIPGVRPKPGQTPPAATPPASGGMDISKLASFDELPPVS